MKNLYNGNIKKEYTGLVKFSLIFTPVILFIISTALLLFGLLYDNVQSEAKIALFVICGICYIFGILYPILTIKLVKIYPKHKKITHLFLQPYVFEDKNQPED